MRIFTYYLNIFEQVWKYPSIGLQFSQLIVRKNKPILNYFFGEYFRSFIWKNHKMKK